MFWTKSSNSSLQRSMNVSNLQTVKHQFKGDIIISTSKEILENAFWFIW
jgi:hypothetical protein